MCSMNLKISKFIGNIPSGISSITTTLSVKMTYNPLAQIQYGIIWEVPEYRRLSPEAHLISFPVLLPRVARTYCFFK